MTGLHQHLLNALANDLDKNNVKVTHLDMEGMPQLFDAKYRHLTQPPPIAGKIPDLRGTDRNGVIHLGEAETDVSGPHTQQTEEQLRVFGNCVMPNTDTPVPLYVIVPSEQREAMESMMRRIGLGDKLGRHVHVWWLRV